MYPLRALPNLAMQGEQRPFGNIHDRIPLCLEPSGRKLTLSCWLPSLVQAQ